MHRCREGIRFQPAVSISATKAEFWSMMESNITAVTATGLTTLQIRSFVSTAWVGAQWLRKKSGASGRRGHRSNKTDTAGGGAAARSVYDKPSGGG